MDSLEVMSSYKRSSCASDHIDKELVRGLRTTDRDHSHLHHRICSAFASRSMAHKRPRGSGIGAPPTRHIFHT
ncbi:hypothetical protein TYRP_022759 [Tyrophagus putrescentiae]|nr:hypothetical protein TYRP_022759 [Tyrophagus putrescentiae]